MNDHAASERWMRHFFYRTEHLRTTWKFRFGLLAFAALVLWLSSGWWTVAIGRSLICDATLAPSDAILIENFDPDYLLFQRARDLRQGGFGARVLVPVPVDPGTTNPNDVALGITEVMSRVSRIGHYELIPIRDVEPITLNAVRDMQSFLQREGIRSVIVVTPLFRSRRSKLVYDATLTRSGIAVYYQPVEGWRGVNSWARTWHGRQEILLQWLKLQYYRLWILPSL